MADLNGDGVNDIAATIDYSFVALLGSHSGTFTQVASFANLTPYALTIGDFNGDGHADVAVVSLQPYSGQGYAVIYTGQGDGAFHSTSTVRATLQTPFDIAAADLNGDGFTDLVVANGGAESATVLLSQGDGQFQPGGNWFTAFPYQLKLGHFTTDGKLGVATGIGLDAVSVIELVTQ